MVLARLLDSHKGIEATKRRARQTMWWPGVISDIVNTVQLCDKCQTPLPSHGQKPMMCVTLPTRPFEEVSADLFSHVGKDFLLYADRLSGWAQSGEYRRNVSSKNTTRLLCTFFVDVGVPVTIQTSGDLQFSSTEFRAFLKRRRVNHVMSRPLLPLKIGTSVRIQGHVTRKWDNHLF